MDLSSLRVFSMLKHKIAYLTERQRVLAQNVANADTPGYKTKDIKIDFDALVKGKSQKLHMVTTHPHHAMSKESKSNFRKVTIRDTGEITPNGNNVIVEDQLLQMQENNIKYQTAVDLYRKTTELIRTAIGDRQ